LLSPCFASFASSCSTSAYTPAPPESILPIQAIHFSGASTRSLGTISGRTIGFRTIFVALDLAQRLSEVMDAYKQQFRQQSVGIITRDACASF